MDHKQFIKRLAALGKISQAIEELMRGAAGDDDLYNNVIALSGRQHRNESERSKGTISNENYKIESAQILNSLTYFLDDYTPPAGIVFDEKQLGKSGQPESAKQENAAGEGRKTVFISYSHSDSGTARKIKLALEKEDVEVLIDEEQLDAGGNIKNFILEMIRSSDVTISLVSKKSLLSGWVGMETILSFQSELFKEGKKFIACALETEFFQDDFVDVCLDEIYDKIDYYNQRIEKRKKRNSMASTVDLDSKLRRYQELSNNLPKIIDRLNESLTLDISGDQFGGGMKKVISTIKGE